VLSLVGCLTLMVLASPQASSRLGTTARDAVLPSESKPQSLSGKNAIPESVLLDFAWKGPIQHAEARWSGAKGTLLRLDFNRQHRIVRREAVRANGPTEVTEFQYVLDADGNVVESTEARPGDAPGQLRRFVYERGRVVETQLIFFGKVQGRLKVSYPSTHVEVQELFDGGSRPVSRVEIERDAAGRTVHLVNDRTDLAGKYVVDTSSAYAYELEGATQVMKAKVSDDRGHVRSTLTRTTTEGNVEKMVEWREGMTHPVSKRETTLDQFGNLTHIRVFEWKGRALTLVDAVSVTLRYRTPQER